MLLRIRKAKTSDKESILKFCQDTFSWGDYIPSVWDAWLKDGGLTVIENDNEPLGMCHHDFLKNQIWIEGLRVNPSFRRRGLASRLVRYSEKIAKRRNCTVSRMLIAQENRKSLKMAKSLGYIIESRWWLYYTKPRKRKSKAIAVSNPTCVKELAFQTFTESWRWYELDRHIIRRLVRNGRIIAYKNAIGIWNKSNIDDCIVQLGYLQGTTSAIQEIIKFIQNKGYLLKARKIQILVSDPVDLRAKTVNKVMPFYLLKKDLL